MSEEERMDRARRLRELREARRASASEESVDEAESSADDGAPVGEADDPAGVPDTDETVAAAVERVTGASADVPGPEALGAAEEEAEAGQTASAQDADDPAAGAARRAEAGTAAAATRVLEFTLGDEQYCLDIDYVEEIVKDFTHTRVPNTPDHVVGVVDLRGQITTILDPKVLLGIADGSPGELLVVFDGDAVDDGGHLGWVVDDVSQVAPVADEDVTDAPGDDAYVEGVVDRGEDEAAFVVWTSPTAALEDVT